MAVAAVRTSSSRSVAPSAWMATPSAVATTNAEINLAITLAVDNGDPNQCGTATTLDVNAGSRINVCYTVTNTGNTPLGFHWLRDNLNTRRFSRGITSVLYPGRVSALTG